MIEIFKQHCVGIVPFEAEELRLMEDYFERKDLKRKEFLHKEGKSCELIGFVAAGTIRHFHVKEGVERTCDISFQNYWVTDFPSFMNGTPSVMNLQAMEASVVFCINKEHLYKLYAACHKFETLSRMITEKVAQRSTEIAFSLSSEKPEERFRNLLDRQPEVFQKVPQKYIANLLGISPESLSRIQKRIIDKGKS